MVLWQSFIDVGGNQIDVYQPTHEKVRSVLEKNHAKKTKLLQKENELC